MPCTVSAGTLKKVALGLISLGLVCLPGDTAGAGQGPEQRPGRPSQARKVVRSPLVVPMVRSDLSQALRDMPPRPPVRGREELEMRKPRPLRGTPQKGGGKKPQDPVLQSTPGTGSMPSTSQNFEGVSNVNGVLPPDTNGAVGPNHYVQWVNLSFAIYDKSGTRLYGPADGNTLWAGFGGGACELSNHGDPIVLHDDLADRWVMSQLALPFFPFGPFYQCIAVSQTADPTGAYYRYEFVISEDKLNDYPKFGVWPDGYYLAVNQFDAITSAFLGQGVVAFEREKMLAGLPARMVYFDLFSTDPNLGGMLPSHADGPAPPVGSPNTYVMVDDDGLGQAAQDQLQFWSFHVDWNDPSASTFSGPTLLATAPFDSNLCNYSRTCIPQPGTTRRVDPIPDRLMYRLQYRNFGTHESLVVNHTVDAGNDQAAIRWYEIRDPQGAPVIYQQGTYAPDSDHRWMGSIAMDGAGDMALGFSVASTSTYPSIRYAGRLAGDPLGTMAQGETELVTGSGSQTHNTGRWGDYSSMNVDPTDHCTFWYTQEYYAITSQSGWQTRIGAFSFPSCTVNLPFVTVQATASQASETGTTGLFTFTRTGSTSADLTVHYAVAGTATAGSDYTALPPSVTIPAGAASATLVVTPLDDLLVEDTETVSVTLSSDPGYAIGSPSNAVVVITSDDVPPDLGITSFSGPSNAGAGSIITVTDTTSNTGGGPAVASVTRFYLSSNTALDAGDVALGERAVPTLAAGASNSASTQVTIPAGTAGGPYYLLAKADADDVVVEAQETNNVANSFIQIGADLVVSSLAAPSAAGAGSSVTVTDTTRNQGGSTAGASITRFFLSTNTLADAGDIVLGERAVASLAPGAVSSASSTLTIPAGTASGSYFLLAKADADDTVAETQEFNNINYGFTQVGPDLLISVLTVPSSAGAGSTISISDLIRNQGGGTAGASTLRLYLSSNTALDAGDVALGNRAVPSLAAGVTNSGSTSVTIPAGTPDGTHYIIGAADADNAVSESQEGNNLRVAQILLGPDLVISAISGPSIAAAGATITVNDTTKNQGGGTAAASTTRFYLSSNTVLDTADTALGSRAVPSLGAGAVNSASTAVTIPAGTAGGTYFILAKADADGTVTETQEFNNVNYTTVQIGADLVISALSAPSLTGAGATITVTDTTKNQSGGTAGASVTRFYLSTNTSLDAADVVLGERSVPSLGPNTTSSASTSVTIPPATAGGAYYLLAKADADNAVPETQEFNNINTAYIRVGPDLIVSQLSVPVLAGAGATITVTDTTRNQGGGNAGSSTTRFYLSLNFALDAGDTPLAERAVPALASGAIQSASTQLTIPAGTASGGYYIIAQADADNAVSETQEFNNINYSFLQIGPDLYVSALTAPSTAAAGSAITVTDSTRNQGAGAAGPSTTRYYLSSNTLVDASDISLGGRAVAALGSGQSDTGSVTVTIPAGTPAGTYYLLAKADADNAVAETQEFNNIRPAVITITVN